MNKLKRGFKSAYGRSYGKICSYHRSRGNKKVYQTIDFVRNLVNIKGKILFIKRDGYRTSYLAGVLYTNGVFSYMLAIQGMKVGNLVESKNICGEQQKEVGVSCPIAYVKLGEKLHNLEYFPGTGGKISRSAGTFSKIIIKYKKNALIKLTSGEFRLFFLTCMCTIGRVSNQQHHDIIIGKAGFNRRLGWRPVVRGRAMNPVDHPHGGRTNGGIVPRTPWGRLTRGVKTRKRITLQIIKKRKK